MTGELSGVVASHVIRPTIGDTLIVHLQQARAFANYLPGGKNHGTVVSEHVMDSAEAAAQVREELDAALALLGAKA